MGNYKEAIAEFLDHETATPNIIDTRRQGRHRYGFGLNFEQSITAILEFSDGSAGATATTNPGPIPKTTASSSSGHSRWVRRGTGVTIAPASPS